MDNTLQANILDGTNNMLKYSKIWEAFRYNLSLFVVVAVVVGCCVCCCECRMGLNTILGVVVFL